jgi:hypothetical protein
MHLARDKGARLESKFFAKGGPDGRSGLNDDMLVGVAYGGPDGFDARLLVYGANGANVYALPAVDALAFAEAAAAERAYFKLVTAVGEIDCSYRLHIIADPDATAAKHAFVCIPGDSDAAGIYVSLVCDFR